MQQYADDAVNDEWDDDFVFADETPKKESRSEKSSRHAPPVDDLQLDFDDPDSNAFGDSFMQYNMDVDEDIPMDAIGFEHISEDEELDNDEPLALDLFGPPHRSGNSVVSGTQQHLSMNSRGSERSSGNFIHLSINSKGSNDRKSYNSVDIGKASIQQRSGDPAVQSISSGTKSMPYDKMSSSESESGKEAKSTLDFGRGDEEDDDDDDDWNQDFMDPGGHSGEETRSIRQSHPFYLEAESTTAAPDKESLLDYLDSNVKRQVLEHSKILRASLSQPAQTEEDGADQVNHHLRGVFGWASNVSDSLQAFNKEIMGNHTLNDRIWEETVQISPTEEFVHQTMEQCKQNPYRESNLYSLEIVARWISGYCVTNEFLQQSNYIIAERICIACLHGMGVLDVLRGVVNNRMVELILILKEEQNALFQRFGTRFGDVQHHKIMERVFECIGLFLTIYRIQCRFNDVQLHLGLIDEYNAVLERIESALDFLDVMVSYVEVVRLCVPLASGEGYKTAQDYLRMGIKQEELIFRTKVTTMVKAALASNTYTSVFYHRFEEKHVQMVREAISDFSGMFMASKLLFLSRISPLTFQPVSYRLLPQPFETRRAAIPYNVAFDLPIGTQCKELMQQLESPSVIRAKLSFALYQYVECLLKRKLVWQADRSRGVFFKKRKGLFMRRNESDLAFGVDAADAAFMNEDMTVSYVEDEITKSLSDSFGSNNELSNQQLFLLLEVAVDLFPKSSLRMGEKPNAQGLLPFTHVSFAMNFMNNIVDHLKDPDKLWMITRKDIGLSSSFYSHMFHFSYAFISAFVHNVSDQAPILALDLIRLQFSVFKCISGEENDPYLLNKAFMLAIKLAKPSVAIHYGETHWVSLINQGADAEKVLFVGDLLAKQYEEEAQYELAIRTLANTMLYMKNECGRRPFKKFQLKLKEAQLDDLSLRLAICFIRLGDHSSAVKILQTLFAELVERKRSLAIDEQKVTVLSWLLHAYLDLGDFECCNRIIKAIKLIRQERLDTLFDMSSDAHNSHQRSAMNMSEHASVSGSSSSMNSMSGFLFSYGSRLSPALNNSTSNNLNHSTSSTANNGASKTSASVMDTSSSYANLGAPYLATPIHAKAYRFQWNQKTANLPQHCITSHSMDLGQQLAKVYYKSGLYVSALNSLTPTIIGVEYAVRGKLGSRDGILELARLYYLRGKIQFEASKTSRAVRFPFEVGSPDVFNAIQSLYMVIPKACHRGRNYALFGRSHAQKRTQRRIIHGSGQHSAASVSRLATSEWSSALRSTIEFNYTCKRGITFSEPADLLWDAMKWFRKAWDLFHTAGDEISAAKAANRIAKCHLLPCFVPFGLLNMPIHEALDLSNFKPSVGSQSGPSLSTNPSTDATSSSTSLRNKHATESDKAKKTGNSNSNNNSNNSNNPGGNNGGNHHSHIINSNSAGGGNHGKRFDFSRILPPPPLKTKNTSNHNYPPMPTPLHPLSSPANNGPTASSATPLNRFVSLEEVEKVSNFSLDIHIETSLPLGLMDSYMNMAELFVLRGMKKDALLYWWEAKDLFLTLFADGCLLPILRRASIGFLQKLSSLLDRIVIFLWIADYRKARDEHVFLLEIHQTLHLEESRLGKTKGARGRAVAADLHKLLTKYVFKSTTTANATAVNLNASNARTLNAVSANTNTSATDKETRVLIKAQVDASTESAKLRGEYLGTGVSTRFSEAFDASGKSTAHSSQLPQQRRRPRGLFGAIFGALSCSSSRNTTAAVSSPATLPPPLSSQSSQRLKSSNNNPNGYDSSRATLEDAQQMQMQLQLQMPGAASSLDASASDELNFPHLSTDPHQQQHGRNSPSRTPALTPSSAPPHPFHPHHPHHSPHHNHLQVQHWRHVVTDAILGQFLGKVIDLPVDQCCCLLHRGYVQEKMFSFSWEQLVFDRVYANGKNQICGTFSASVKQHVLTWVDLLGEDGLAQQQTNKFLPDLTWRKMQQRSPLHPVEDFAWLNHDFWQSTNTKKPPSSSSASSSTAGASSSNARADFDFMSFWDIACKYHGAVSERARARVAEDVLIERLWHLLLHIRNACRHYADKFASIKSFSRSVRSTLLKYAGNMLRLRSFSQQFKADLVNTSAMNALFRRVMPTMRGSTPRGGIADFNNGNGSNNPFLSTDAPVNPHSMGSAEDAAVNALHLLQLRMTKMVYILQVREMLLLFHPSSGRDYKQQLGGNAARYPLSPKAGDGGSNGIAAFHSSSFPSEVPLHHHQALNPAALMLLSSSAANSTARNQLDWRLSTRESQLLFDFCAQDVDERCGGGAALRAQSLQSMSSGALHGALVFLISCGSPTHGSNNINNQSFSSRTAVGGIGYDTHALHHNHNSNAHDTSSNHSESTHDLLRPMRSLLGGMLSSGHHAHHTPTPPPPLQQQSPAAAHNQHHHSTALPLSLICGLPAHALPWEALVGAADVTVTRSLGVMSLFMQMVSLLCADDNSAPRSLAQSHSLRLGGFQKSLKPVFTLVSSQKTLAESRTQDPLSDLVARIENRRTRSAVQAISALQHPCDHLAILRHNNNNNNNATNNVDTSPFSPSGGIAALSTAQAAAVSQQRRAQQQRLKLDRVLIQRLRHGLLPLPSLLPQFNHIATLFARGDLLVVPLNFSTPNADAGVSPSHLKPGAGGGAAAQWETESRMSDIDIDPLSSEALVPSSALVESECKDLRVEVGLFCQELDNAVASYVRRLPSSQQVSDSPTVPSDASTVHRLLSVLILSHCDLVEMNPTTLALLSRTRTSTGSMPLSATSTSSKKDGAEVTPCQPIVLFAPPCVQEHLLVELKLALDRWHRGDLQLGQSFDYGGGSLYSSSAHSSAHSMSLSPVANNHHGLSTVSLVQPQSSRSSRWPSLRSRSASIDRLSSGSRGNSKSDLHISVSSATAAAAHFSVGTSNGTTNNHNSIGSVNSQLGGILLHNLPSPMAPATNRDSTNSILSAGYNNNGNNNRSRRSSESEPFSNLDRVESASASHFSAFFFAPRPQQSGLSSLQGSDFVASHQRFFRAGSGTSQNSRGNSLQLPPPPPPLSLQLSHLQASPGPAVESHIGGDQHLVIPALGSPTRDRDSDRIVDRTSSPAPGRVISDPCLIILQVVQRLQAEHAVNITVFL